MLLPASDMEMGQCGAAIHIFSAKMEKHLLRWRRQILKRFSKLLLDLLICKAQTLWMIGGNAGRRSGCSL